MLAMARQPSSIQPTAAGGASLDELALLVGGKCVGDGSVVVQGVQQDSRRVEPGDLFVALRGQRADGLDFVQAAVARGAVAVLLERGRALSRSLPGEQLPVLEVDTPRKSMAQVAARVYGEPTLALTMVGITGTNGKTTSAHIVAACLRGTGVETGVMGTLGSHYGGLALPSGLTSPEADELQRVAATMRDNGATHLVMEASSIALAAERVEAVDFDVAVFTNLTQDHLDYHGSMGAYADAKDSLFFEHHPRVAVINVDDPHGRSLADRIAAAGGCRLLRVSNTDTAADVHAIDAPQWGDIAMAVQTPSGRYQLSAPLQGAHNVSNLLTAVAVVEALELDTARAIAALSALSQVPGRLERCSAAADDIEAYVDYAHTPDALANVLRACRKPEGRLWCVFGCGGDRDADKRALMGEVAAGLADELVVTNDNPRSEDPADIAAAIVAGVERVDGARHRVELDRRSAIRMAVHDAADGDTLVVAGKGHEPYQIVGERRLAFDDRVELREALVVRREKN
jgi:UDP-N-acetylmuramoyl-L-alanyl-D-glutamate--2,6-diaminopimelate ligase